MRILKPLPGTLPMPVHNIVGDWPLNSLGNRAFDRSGNGNHGAITNDTHFVPGKFGYALDFDGINDYVLLDNAIPAMNIATIIARVKVDKDDNCSVAGIAGVATSTAILIYDSLDRFYVAAGDGNQQFWNYPDGTFNKWRQVAAVCDGTNAYAYIDGVSIGAGKALARITGIERLGDGHIYDYGGQIDYIILFDQVLTASEIAQFYRESFYRYPENRVFAVA